MSRLLEGTVSIVTGAASGIGRSTAEAFGREGAAVVLVDRAREVTDVAASMPGPTLAVELDLVALDRLGGVVEQAVDRFGRVDHGNLVARASEPSDVAGVIVFLCSAASGQITGQTIHTSAGAIV